MQRGNGAMTENQDHFVWIGHSVSHNAAANVAAHSISGVPNDGQLVYSIHIPIGMVVCAVGALSAHLGKSVTWA
jgi:hypothetical protein